MLSAGPAARNGLDRGVGFRKSLAWSGLLLAGVLYIADPLTPFSSYIVPIRLLAADSDIPSPLAEIRTGEDGAHHDEFTTDDAEGAEPFGMETEPVPDGALLDKWRRVEAKITKDLEIIGQCQAGNPCSALAQKLIDLSLEGAGRNGRTRVGVINRAVDLAISPASDAKKWGVQDHWSDPLETLHDRSGDCEDYAFVKYAALLATGFSKDAVKIVVLRNRWPNEEHAVVAVRVDHQWLILDNRTLALVRDTDVVRAIPEFVLDDRGVQANYSEQSKSKSGELNRLCDRRSGLVAQRKSNCAFIATGSTHRHPHLPRFAGIWIASLAPTLLVA